jgi:hypothetical protein
VPFRIEGKMRRISTVLGPRRRGAETERSSPFIAASTLSP